MPSTTPVTPPASATPPTRRRDPWFDNAKMALVTLVVVGHSWTLLPHNAVNDQLYDFLYAWHVPAFVFVTGYLSRSFTYTRARMWQLFCTVVVPYVLFETALSLFRIYVGGEQLADVFADPHWPMWYLSALFFWRLLTPPFKALPHGLVVAVAVSLLAGMYAGDTLDMARVLGLLPFFVMGLKATPERLELLRTPRARRAAVAVLAVIFVLSFWIDSWASTEWLYYRSQYGDLETSDLHAMLIRAGLLVTGTLGAWAFLALVPRVHGWFTRMGAWTLVVYLFHGFVVKSALYLGYGDWAAGHAAVSLVLTTVLAVLVALGLAWAPVATRLTHVVDPLGYAQHHLREAVALTVVTADAEEHADVLVEALEEGIADGEQTSPPVTPPYGTPVQVDPPADGTTR
ncbi:acyltransferase family protein [Nocardioides sp. KIGAM211]|uniref:Acyltransferase family protein n=1 Tax=Nocardioides luti TaxID=2761101 RepID=A0A7X0VBQ4_9ACTN|nr:acyltransferase family protein [Nocardioides luti]MBB6629009.1 acyltransferase family protein [Nocardioides luti]